MLRTRLWESIWTVVDPVMSTLVVIQIVILFRPSCEGCYCEPVGTSLRLGGLFAAVSGDTRSEIECGDGGVTQGFFNRFSCPDRTLTAP